MRAMPAEIVAVREIPRRDRMNIGIEHQQAARVEHEQRAGVGQLGNFLRKQGVHAGAVAVAQCRNLLPHFASAVKRCVHRLQHARGPLLDDLREVAGGALGIVQAGGARLGEGEKRQGEEGDDQQGGKPRDQVGKTLALSRAFNCGRSLGRHGNRGKVTLRSVPRKLRARDAIVHSQAGRAYPISPVPLSPSGDCAAGRSGQNIGFGFASR